jgi:hypothetical protein
MPRKTATSPASISGSPAPVVYLREGTVPEPARKLGKDGHALWGKLHREYQIDDEPTLEQVLQVCQAVDLAESTDDPRSELAARNFVCKVLKNLFADDTKRGPGRPPGRGGNPW